MKSIGLIIRMVLTCVLALAALYAAAFPDTILSPHWGEGTAYERIGQYAHGLMWMLPLAVAELVSCMGRDRNRVWYTGLFAAWGLTALAMPLLRLHAPEWVSPAHDVEGVKLYAAFLWMSLFLIVSLFFRMGVLRYLFPPYSEEEGEGYYSGEVMVMSPRTVQEIAAAPPRRRRYFLFGKTDDARIRSWGRVGHAALALLRVKARAIFAALLSLLVWNVGVYYVSGGAKGERERDLQRMGEYRRSSESGKYKATDRAVHAAYRLFHEADRKEVFNGKTKRDLVAYFALNRWNSAYLKQAMNPLAGGDDDIFSIKEAWLTVDDGTKKVTLSLYMNRETDRINVIEVDEKGWDPRLDDYKSSLGADWGSNR